MTETITDTTALPLLGADWSDPIEDGIRSRVRGFIEAIIEEELEPARGPPGARGLGTFGSETIRVPRARLNPLTSPHDTVA